MSLTPKTLIGTYEVIGALGEGGMSEVYRAKDLRLGRDIALKVLSSKVASSSERLERFEREALALAGLNHPNIVTLYSVDCVDNIHFITMELVEGQTLMNLIVPGGLPTPRLFELVLPLTDAIAAAHERGVVHRDLKARNIMVTREGRVKVLDFGLAKITHTDSSSNPTVTAASPISALGQVMGTVPYMSPEQIRGETVDARSDLFSLGIII